MMTVGGYLDTAGRPRYALGIDLDPSSLLVHQGGRPVRVIVDVDADELRSLQRRITAEIARVAAETRQA